MGALGVVDVERRHFQADPVSGVDVMGRRLAVDRPVAGRTGVRGDDAIGPAGDHGPDEAGVGLRHIEQPYMGLVAGGRGSQDDRLSVGTGKVQRVGER